MSLFLLQLSLPPICRLLFQEPHIHLRGGWIATKASTVEPPNNGHSGDRPLVNCRKVVPISEVMPCMLQSVGDKQFVHSTEVVRFSVFIIRGSTVVFLQIILDIFPDHAVSK